MTMPMSPSVRKFALTAHIICSVGVLGAIAAFLVLAIAGLISWDTQVIRAVYLSMDLLTKSVIIPLAVAALISGLIQSLGTPWGLFRHHWVVAKLVITAFATAVLLAKLRLIGHAASLAVETILPLAELRRVGRELAFHAAAGLLVLLIPTVLSVYKPRGLTTYGRRKQQELMPPSTPKQSRISIPTGDASNALGDFIILTLHRGQLLAGLLIIVVVHVFILHEIGSGLSLH